MADSSGAVLLVQTFDPYGSPYSQSIASSWPGDTSFGFAGEYTDANGLVFLRARYSPGMECFLNMDSSRQETNPYWYSYSNPVNYITLEAITNLDPEHNLIYHLAELGHTSFEVLPRDRRFGDSTGMIIGDSKALPPLY